jgi:hypothetical protein
MGSADRVARVRETDWVRLVRQLRDGNCTPFLGAGACYRTLPTGRQLSRIWSTEYKYPFGDGDLARVAQYAAHSVGDPVTLKEELARMFAGCGQPDFTDPAEPHRLLASLPLPVFLTTNYDDFMVTALRRAGKDPQAAICPWYDARAAGTPPADRIGIDYVPGPARPLVYHLHGSIHRPESLVLTEADYLEFLVTVAQRGPADTTVLPPVVNEALSSKALLFIGYSLQDWTFKVLFHGLHRKIATVARRRHISVQLVDVPQDQASDGHHRAREYLTRLFDEWNITVFWGSAQDFCAELSRRLEAAV